METKDILLLAAATLFASGNYQTYAAAVRDARALYNELYFPQVYTER